MPHTDAAAEYHSGHHVVPIKTLATVFGALVALTALTVLTAVYVDLGAFNVPLALAIAGSKALLVVTFFMALKYDSPVNRLVLGMGTIFVSIFLIFTLFDTLFRGSINNVDPLTIQDLQRQEEAALAEEERLNASMGAPAAAAAATDTTASTGTDTTATTQPADGAATTGGGNQQTTTPSAPGL